MIRRISDGVLSMIHPPFNITNNLHDFLTIARRSGERRGPYWVNALFINQRDEEEKGAQIAMMRVIYKSTQEAVIWLGLVEDESDLANTLLWWLAQKDARTI